uniref:Uncharacterized protein n=1 Tax=Glossina austeni TaxID=7395 RepID=A0A1A9UP30_GLOAU
MSAKKDRLIWGICNGIYRDLFRFVCNVTFSQASRITFDPEIVPELCLKMADPDSHTAHCTRRPLCMYSESNKECYDCTEILIHAWMRITIQSNDESVIPLTVMHAKCFLCELKLTICPLFHYPFISHCGAVSLLKSRQNQRRKAKKKTDIAGRTICIAETEVS